MIKTKLIKVMLLFIVVLFLIMIGGKSKLSFEKKGQANHTLEKIEYRKDLAYRFVKDKLTSPCGGIYTNFITNKTYEYGIQGNDISSENVALMMAYAIIEKDLSLFERQFKYLTEYMITDMGFIPWYVEADGSLEISSTSTLDDLRMSKQLIKAYELWGKKKHIIKAADIIANIHKYGTNNFSLTNYFNWDEDEKSNRIDLAYLDISALELFSKVDSNFKVIKNNGLKILNQSIGDSFPFYRQTYYYANKNYLQEEEVNIINLLLIALNKSSIGDGQLNVIKWLKNELEVNKRIFGKYKYHFGIPAVAYESIPAYALGVRLAVQENDLVLADRLLNKLLSFQDLNSFSTTYGGFVIEAGGESYSFDNLQAINSLAFYEKRLKENN